MCFYFYFGNIHHRNVSDFRYLVIFFLENYVYIRFCVCLRSMPGTKSYHGWFINRSINVLKAYTSYNVYKTPGSSYRALSNFFSLFHNNINISSTFLRNTIDKPYLFLPKLVFSLLWTSWLRGDFVPSFSLVSPTQMEATWKHWNWKLIKYNFKKNLWSKIANIYFRNKPDI